MIGSGIESAQHASAETGLVRYDKMVLAIAVCHRVDEVLAIRDKAKALEIYAKQAKNFAAERKLTQIKMRAERRIGQLLLELKESGEWRGGQGGDRKSSSAKELGSLSSFGLSKKQSFLWQKLAKIPEQHFETFMTSGKTSTTYELLRKEALRKAEEEYTTEEWQSGGQPEFVQEDQSPHRTIHVHFESDEAVAAFAKLVGQKITPKTRFLWYPPAEIGHYAGLEYVDAPESSEAA